MSDDSDLRLAIGGTGFRWLDRSLVGHPLLSSLVAGLAAGGFVMTDAPVDWGLAVAVAAIVAAAILFSGSLLRRRARRYLSDVRAGPG